MKKKIISVVIFIIMVISPSANLIAADMGDLFYEAYTGWNSAGFGRTGHRSATIMGVDTPWTHIGKEINIYEPGGDGVRAENWDEFKKPVCPVYWIQTAVFPKDDILVLNADSKDITPYFLPSGSLASYIVGGNNSAPSEWKGSATYKTRVRFDDYNADRYIFSNEVSSKVYNDYMWFDKDGNVYVATLDDGVAVSKQIYTGWKAGQWYDVEMSMHFDFNTISIKINGQEVLSNAPVKTTIGWANLIILWPKQEDGTVEERQFANSYFSGCTGVYSQSPQEAPPKDNYYYKLDFTLYSEGFGRQNHGSAWQCNPRQPWLYTGESTTLTIGGEGMLPFENEYRGVKKVYMIRTGLWPEGDTGKVSMGNGAEGIPGAASPFFYTGSYGYENSLILPESERETNTMQWKMKIRLDDNNTVRNVFALGEYISNYKFSNIITFNRDQTIGVTFQNGPNRAVVSGGRWEIGKWHEVRLVFHTDINVFSVYLDDEPIATNVKSPVDIFNVSRIKYLEQIQTKEVVTERLASNTYVDYVKAEFLPDPPKIWIKNQGFTQNDLPAENIGEGKLQGKATVANITDEDTKVKVFMALYKNNQLYGLKTQSVNLKSVKSKTVEFELNVPNGTGYSARFFAVGDGFGVIPQRDETVTSVKEYYYILDFVDNNSGYARNSHTVAMHCNVRQPWTYSGKTTTETLGTEGMLPFGEDYTKSSNKIYWIKTGVWPTDDTEKVITAANAVIVPQRTTTYVTMEGPTYVEPLLLKPYNQRDSQKISWEARVRFDDYNATRSVFSMHDTGSGNYKDFIIFGTDGKLTGHYKENGEYKSSSCDYSVGDWYDITLTMNMDKNTYSLDVTNKGVTQRLVSDKEATCDLDGWDRIKILNHQHLTLPADINEREFSNSYLDYIKASYVE